MGTYFHGNPSEIGVGAGNGGDGLQTLILMNPAYVGYSDNNQPPPPQSSNFVFLNSNSAANNSHAHTIPHAPPSQTQHFVGIPLQGTTTSSPHDQQDVSALHGFLPPRVHYNLYNLPVDLGAARDVTRAQQGLSLSLSSQQPPLGYGSFRDERTDVVVPSQATAGRADDVRISGGSPAPASGVTNGLNGVQSVLLSSKYLKAAQELLEEVVNVGRGAKSGTESSKGQPRNIGDTSTAAANGDGQSGGESCTKRVAELTTAERQEVQMKKSKLVNMLDEVEQRYRQYHQQMQMVISWFEGSGLGSAKTYTALALDTISKQFRCLKDAILTQIRAASKSLGEHEICFQGGGSSRINEVSSLKYVDNQIRQQRALQQLGMIQPNAWRPQRGLPERSVSVLRAWLFEHFLHPYPKDSDKLMLAKQTGLTRGQVSNWFINARVRLWKPMVEEMYMEEMKEHDKKGSEDNSKSEHNEDSTSKSTTAFPQAKSPVINELIRNKNMAPKQNNLIINNPNNNNNTPPMISMSANSASFNIIGSSSEIESITQNSPKKLRIANMLSNTIPISMSIMDTNKPTTTDERQGRDDGFTLMGAPANFIGGFGSYPMGELGRFGPGRFHHQAPYSGNGVSLTLGLPHCENLGAHQTFMPNQSMLIGRGVEIGETNGFSGMNAQTNAHSNNVYENISIHEDRKRFVAQLLPDFVA